MTKKAGQQLAYIRVSSVDQNTDRQLADTGITFDKTFTDKCSGGSKDRPALTELMEYARTGDTVNVHSIDRLARNIDDLRMLVAGWTGKGITVKFHKEGLTFSDDTSNPMNELLLNMLGAVAQFERAMIKERQREGIEKAKKKGVYKGRKHAVDPQDILKLLNTGMSVRKVAAALNVSTATVQRAKAYKDDKAHRAFKWNDEDDQMDLLHILD